MAGPVSDDTALMDRAPCTLTLSLPPCGRPALLSPTPFPPRPMPIATPSLLPRAPCGVSTPMSRVCAFDGPMTALALCTRGMDTSHPPCPPALLPMPGDKGRNGSGEKRSGSVLLFMWPLAMWLPLLAMSVCVDVTTVMSRSCTDGAWYAWAVLSATARVSVWVASAVLRDGLGCDCPRACWLGEVCMGPACSVLAALAAAVAAAARALAAAAAAAAAGLRAAPVTARSADPRSTGPVVAASWPSVSVCIGVPVSVALL